MSLIKMPYEVSKEFYLKALLYGQPGIGKSTAALSMPKPILIDCDNGIHRIAAAHRPPYLPVTNYEEVLEVVKSKEIAPFETIVIDTAGKLLDYMGAWIIQNNPKEGRKNGELTMQGYGTRKREFINLLKAVSVMGKHLIFVAHEKEEKNGDDRYIRPDIGGSSGADLIKELDLVGYMEAIARKRTVCFQPTEKYYAKNSARMNDTIEIPELKPGQTNNFMTGIVQKCIASFNEESETAKVYDELMSDIAQKVELVTDADLANALLKELSEADHLWDSKARSWELLQARCTELGIEFDKSAKAFKSAKAA